MASIQPGSERVVLTTLEVSFDKFKRTRFARPVQPLNASIQPEIISLQVRAFVWKAVTAGSATGYFHHCQHQTPASHNAACTATFLAGRIGTDHHSNTNRAASERSAFFCEQAIRQPNPHRCELSVETTCGSKPLVQNLVLSYQQSSIKTGILETSTSAPYPVNPHSARAAAA